MTCSRCNNDSCSCNPCSATVTTEGLYSQVQNFIRWMFGEITVTVDDEGRGVWSTPCTPYDNLSCHPRGASEGYACYLLRLFSSVAFIDSLANGWSSALEYCEHSLVSNGAALYFSIRDVPVGIDISDVTYWFQVLVGPPGPQGNAGPPGSPGASGSPVDALRTFTGPGVLNNTDEVIYLNAATPQTQPIPTQASLLANKRYFFINEGAGTWTLSFGGANVGGLPGSAGTATLDITTGESFWLRSKNTGFWYKS